MGDGGEGVGLSTSPMEGMFVEMKVGEGGDGGGGY